MASQPLYANAPKVGAATISVANNLRDGNGTIGTIFVATGTGSRIDKIIIKALNTTTAGTVRLFIHNGSTSYLFTEIAVDAITVSANQPAFESVIDVLGGLILPSGHSLRASTEKGESFNVVVFGGDF